MIFCKMSLLVSHLGFVWSFLCDFILVELLFMGIFRESISGCPKFSNLYVALWVACCISASMDSHSRCLSLSRGLILHFFRDYIFGH